MSDNKVQGEGDYDATRRFNKSSEKFAKSEQGKASAKKHDHTGKFDEEQLEEAEDQASERKKDGHGGK